MNDTTHCSKCGDKMRAGLVDTATGLAICDDCPDGDDCKAVATTTTSTMTKVIRTRIIGTTVDVYSAWEPTSMVFHTHSTITSTMVVDGEWYGRIGTASLPKTLDDLPAMSDERITAVEAWHATEYERAYDAILDRFPRLGLNDENISRSMGEIVDPDGRKFAN